MQEAGRERDEIELLRFPDYSDLRFPDSLTLRARCDYNMCSCSHAWETPRRQRLPENFFRADVAQLVEQSIRNRQVIGSSPIVGSIIQ
jgi:hypothetical protein